MKRYAVLTTPTCLTCRILSRLADKHQWDMEFFDVLSNSGQKLLNEYDVTSAGQVIDLVDEKVIPGEEFLNAQTV